MRLAAASFLFSDLEANLLLENQREVHVGVILDTFADIYAILQELGPQNMNNFS